MSWLSTRFRVQSVTTIMMTSSNGHIFRVTGHLCGECTGPGEFPAQRPVTPSFDVFFDLRLNNRLSKQSGGWWFETLSCPLWRHFNDNRYVRNGVQCFVGAVGSRTRAVWRKSTVKPYIRSTKSPNLTVSCLLLQIFAQCIESRCWVKNEDVIGAAPSDQHVYCPLRCMLY